MEDIHKIKALLNSEPEKRVGEQVGNYRLIGWLGRGAFADVYLGEHIYLKMQSAIKMLHMHLPEKAVKAFLNEACTIARLEHPHIVRVLDYGVENGTPFLVMAYAPNGSLRQCFPEGTRVPLEQIVPLVQHIAWALDYAHRQGVIHRDVKPENILIGAQDQVLLSDFGLALVVQSMHSQAAKAMAGTVLYMAPEMVEGKVHFASDQYALGIMTYEWLCGQCPFTGSSIQVGTQHMSTSLASLCERVPDLPPAVEHVVFKALAKDRSQRYANVTAFANALQDASSTIAHSLTPQSSSSFSETVLTPEETSTWSGPIKSPESLRTLVPFEEEEVDESLGTEPSGSSGVYEQSLSGMGELTSHLTRSTHAPGPHALRASRSSRMLLTGVLLLSVIFASFAYTFRLSGIFTPGSSFHPTHPSIHSAALPVFAQIPSQNAYPTLTPSLTMQPSVGVVKNPAPIPTATLGMAPTATPSSTNTTTIDDAVVGAGTNQFNYVGGWSHCTNCGSELYNHSNSWDHTPNDYVTLTFTGVQIRFYSVLDTKQGIGAVSVDGGNETMLDFYAATRAGDQLVWTSPMLSAGTHTFKLRVTSNKNPSSSNTCDVVDRVDILS